VAPEKPTAEEPAKHADAVQHISDARQILQKMKEKNAAPREALVEAIDKLERALAILSVKTGGWL